MTEEKREVSRLSPLHSAGRAPQSANANEPDQTALIRIAVVDQHSFTRGCITRSLRDFDDHLQVVSFTTPEDCLENVQLPAVILYHAHEDAHESNNTRLAPIRKLLEVAPVIVLSAAEDLELIMEAFESGARGYIPTASTPAELVVEIIRLVRAGGTFVPPSGLRLQKIARKRLVAGTATEQQFTPRQIAVLNHLTQGKANKTIAYELAMSESTVKVHIRNIMKKMHASNRTEVACRAQAFAQTRYAEAAAAEPDQ
jgi:DNA-binding NarL/FixJ family response regulator